MSLRETFIIDFILHPLYGMYYGVTSRKMNINKLSHCRHSDRNRHTVNKNRYNYVKATSGNIFGAAEYDTFFNHSTLSLTDS